MGKYTISTGPWLQVRKLLFIARGYPNLKILAGKSTIPMGDFPDRSGQSLPEGIPFDLKPKQHFSGLSMLIPFYLNEGRLPTPRHLGVAYVAKRQDRPDYVMLRKLFADLRAGMPKRCVILGSLELWEYPKYYSNDI